MKSRWLACLLIGSTAFVHACKGGGSSSGFLEVVGTAPDPGEDQVQVEARIAVRVSEPIDTRTLDEQSFFLTDEDGEVVPSTVSIVEEPDASVFQMGTLAELKPESPLAVLTTFTVTVTTGLRSTSGNTLEEDFDWSFKTVDAEWGESEWIEDLGPWASSAPQIALDEQLSAIAVWQFDDQGESGIFANRYTRVDLWGEPQEIDDFAGASSNPRVAADAAGNAFAVWERQVTNTEANIWANRYEADGGGWGEAALLQEGEVTAARNPRVAADPSGNAFAVWVQRSVDEPLDVMRAIRYEPSSGWGQAATIAMQDRPGPLGARIAIGMDDAGDAVVVWDQIAGPAGEGGRVLWANRYTTSQGWGEAVLIKSDELTSANNFQMDVGANGEAHVVWVQDNGDDAMPRDDIWATHFSDGLWSTPERIDDCNDTARPCDKTDPDVAVDGQGMAYAVWSQRDADFANIWAARYASSGWATPELIEPPNEDPADDGDATTPRVDVNRAGNAFVVWRQVWDQWPSIWSNRLDPGTSWMTAAPIEDIPEAAARPIIAVDEGRHAHALWPHNNASGRKIRTNRFE